MSISQMTLMLHHSMNLKIILHLLLFHPLFHNASNWLALSRAWNQLKILKLLENYVASYMNIEGLVFCLESRFQTRLPSGAEPSQS